MNHWYISALLFLTICHHASSVLTQSEKSNNVAQKKLAIIRRTVGDLFSSWFRDNGKSEEDSFIGRCFGMARKLKFVMPMIIFKLGVIVTTLGFLTLFSLKSLGLLILLVVMKTSGIVSKLTLLKAEHHKEASTPQKIHLHLHQTKDGLYSVDHPYGGWNDRKSILTGNDPDLNIYDPYRR